MLRAMLQFGQYVFYFLTTYQVSKQSHFTGRCRIISKFSYCFHLLNFEFRILSSEFYSELLTHDYFYADASIFLLECPLNWRVGANSPNLCPTINSVIYTGINLFPLCTANVCPTKSGVTVERRLQVLITDFLFLPSFIA